MLRRRRLIIGFVILAAIVAAAASYYWRDQLTVLARGALSETTQPADTSTTAAAATATEPAAVRPASATVEPARMAEVLAQVPVTGTLVARQEVQIYPQVSGFEVEEIAVEAGDRVEAGQVLARLSDATLKAQLSQAEAELQRAEAGVSQSRSQIASGEAALKQAKAALDRAQRLQQSGNTSQASLDQAVADEAAAQAALASSSDGVAVAQAQVAQAEAARDIARLNVERTQIKSPVAGFVSARSAERGAIAGSAAEPMFTIIAKGEIEVAGEVIETALESLHVGDPASMRVAGVGDVQGKVRLVPASVDAVTRLGIVRVQLEANPALRTGLFASGWVTTERKDAVTVPSTAVLSASGGDGDIVQVVRDGRVVTTPVTAGLLWQDRREIIRGLQVGDVVVARAPAFFRDGDPVEAVTAEAQSAPATAAPAATPAPAAAAAPATGGTAP